MLVVICWKIRIFAYWTTPYLPYPPTFRQLWFAEKFVSLLIEQHQLWKYSLSFFSCDLLKNSYLCLLNNTWKQWKWQKKVVVICWKIRIFAYWTTPRFFAVYRSCELWFAEKFVSLLIEQHRKDYEEDNNYCCDLLKNSYLCLLNNTHSCLLPKLFSLWFAEKFVSLLIEQHHHHQSGPTSAGCDLLKNSYLCLLNNTWSSDYDAASAVVICWKIRIFAYWTTPSYLCFQNLSRCDLLKNSYLCLLNNT